MRIPDTLARAPEAWEIIGAEIRGRAPTESANAAPTNGAGAPFTENILRTTTLTRAADRLFASARIVPLGAAIPDPFTAALRKLHEPLKRIMQDDRRTDSHSPQAD